MKFPKVIKHRRFEAIIYGKSKKYAYYRLAYYAAGKRHTRHFRAYGEAKTEAERIVRELADGSQSAAAWGKQQPWREQFFHSEKTPIDIQKAAAMYEALRRRPEVQQAWRDGKFSFGHNGWQFFTGWVIQNLPKSWVELDKATKGGIIHAMYSPWFIPPKGYSTVPDKSIPEQCRKVAMQVLRLPPSDEPVAAQGFVKRARKFADAGFLIVAVDNKTAQSVRYACEAIADLPRSFRKSCGTEAA